MYESMGLCMYHHIGLHVWCSQATWRGNGRVLCPLLDLVKGPPLLLLPCLILSTMVEGGWGWKLELLCAHEACLPCLWPCTSHPLPCYIVGPNCPWSSRELVIDPNHVHVSHTFQLWGKGHKGPLCPQIIERVRPKSEVMHGLLGKWCGSKGSCSWVAVVHAFSFCVSTTSREGFLNMSMSYIYVCVFWFEPEFFQFKYNLPTFEYKIHFIEVALYYFKCL